MVSEIRIVVTFGKKWQNSDYFGEESGGDPKRP